MPKQVCVDLTLSMSSVARNVHEVIVEGRDLSRQVVFSQGEWKCIAEGLPIGTTDQENDLDIFIRLSGDPKVACPIAVKIKDKKPKEFKEKFNNKGWLYFIKSIPIGEFEDEKE